MKTIKDAPLISLGPDMDISCGPADWKVHEGVIRYGSRGPLDFTARLIGLKGRGAPTDEEQADLGRAAIVAFLMTSTSWQPLSVRIPPKGKEYIN